MSKLVFGCWVRVTPMRVDTQLQTAIRRDTLSRCCASKAAECPLPSKKHQKLEGIISLATFDVHCQHLCTPTQRHTPRAICGSLHTTANPAKSTAVQANFNEQASHFSHASGIFAQEVGSLKGSWHYLRAMGVVYGVDRTYASGL